MAYRILQGIGPYRQQPPSGIRTERSGVGYGLVYASAIPFQALESRLHGWLRPSNAGAAPSFGATPFLGRSLVTISATTTPVQFTGATVVAPPFTTLVNFRFNTQATQGTLISFGGSSVGNGWAFAADSNNFSLTFGNVAGYFFTMPRALVAGVDYTVIVECTANGGTTTVWFRRKDSETEGIQNTDTLAVGTMQTPTQPLTLGAAYNNTSFVDPFDGHIGAFAIWNRTLSQSEKNSLIDNPYQLWHVPDFGALKSTLNSYTLTADTASYIVSSNPARLLWGHRLVATVGAESVTGNAAILARGRIMAAATANYSITGTVTNFRLTRKIVAAVGSMSITGNAALFFKGRTVSAATANYSIVSSTTALSIARRMTASPGSFTITGNAVQMRKGRTMIAVTATYDITAPAVVLATTGHTVFNGRSRAATIAMFEKHHQQTQAELRQKLASTLPLTTPVKTPPSPATQAGKALPRKVITTRLPVRQQTAPVAPQPKPVVSQPPSSYNDFASDKFGVTEGLIQSLNSAFPQWRK